MSAIRRVGNWFRKKFDRPVKFDFEAALREAQQEAHDELARLEDPDVAAEVACWEHQDDPDTDGIACDRRLRDED